MSQQSEMHLYAPGHAGCPGCAPSTTLIQICDTLGKDIVVVNATGCMEITSSQYPHSAWRVPYIHSLFENAPAVATGVVTALRAKGNDHTTVVVIAGDGSTYDIGFGSLSGLLERGDDVLYVCLHPDEELLLGDGSIQKIGEFVETQFELSVQSNKTVKQLQQIGFQSVGAQGNVMSFNGQQFSIQNIERVQKKKSPQTLVRVRTRSGGSILLTPEHKILTDSVLGTVWKRADELQKGDLLFSARQLPIPTVAARPDLTEILRTFFGQKLHEQNGAFTMQGAKPFKVKDKLNEDIVYLLGLICSEGSLGKANAVTFTNTDEELLDFAESIFLNYFGGRKVNKIIQNGIPRLTFCHPALSALCKQFDIKNDPKRLLSLDNTLLSHFIAGCFEGDGCASVISHKNGVKETRALITTVKPQLAKRLKLMLARLGIASSILQSARSDVILYGKTDILRFVEKIPVRGEFKKGQLKTVKELCNSRIHSRTRHFDLAPRASIFLIEQALATHQKSGDWLDNNWSEIRRGKRGMTKRKLLSLMPKLKTISSSETIQLLESNCLDDFFMDPVAEVSAVRSDTDFVYDITVSNTHSFVPSNALFTISNCYDNELYANTGVQKSGATPFGAATTTSHAGKAHPGKDKERKPIVEIAAAHNIAYAASASIAFMADFKMKLKKAQGMKGTRFITVHAPCCLGAGFDGGLSMKFARTAVQSRLWFLFEIENGKFKLNFNAKAPKPVTEYLTGQKRFAHLSAEQLMHIQAKAEENYAKMVEWHARSQPLPTPAPQAAPEISSTAPAPFAAPGQASPTPPPASPSLAAANPAPPSNAT